MNRWTIVARRELRTRVLSPVNWIITLVLMAIVGLGAAVGPTLLDDLADQGSSWRLADDAATQQVAQELGIPAPAGENEDASSVLALAQNDGELVVTVTGSVPSDVLGAIEHGQALADARDLAAQSGVDYTPTTVVVDVVEGAGQDMTTFVVAIAVVALIFAFVMLSATSLATGLVEEKSTNVVEILAPYVPARHLLFGKIVAIGLFTFAQALLLAVTAIAASAWSGSGPSLDPDTIALVGSGLLWLVIAYFSFGALFAVAASLVSSQEDAGALLNPLGIGLFVPLYAATFVAVPDPESTVTVVLSFLPLFAPFIMPVRQAYTEVPLYEILASAAIGLVVASALLWVAARAYERTILRRGRRLTLRDALGGTPAATR